MTTLQKGTDHTHCERCGLKNSPLPQSPQQRLNLSIRKGCVRRAIRAADEVYGAANEPNGPALDVVFMTTVILIERLCRSFRSEPLVVLDHILRCFVLKRRFGDRLRGAN